MSTPAFVVKHHGRRSSESFVSAKLHASIYAACLSVRSLDGLASDTAARVCEHVIAWMEAKPEVTSADIRRQAAAVLERLHPDAAYLYQHHKQIM